MSIALPRTAFAALIWALVALLLACACPGRADALACSATVTDVDFGAPNLLSTSPSDVMATVTITCTSIPLLTSIKLCPSIGTGSGGTSGAARVMTGSGANLTYQLYQDSSRTLAWGSVDNADLGTVPPLTFNGGLTGSATVTRTLYGRLFGSQTGAPPGNYVSHFTGAQTAFSYATYLIGASGTCTGFVGTAVIHPEFDVLAAPPAGCTITANDLPFPATGVLSNVVTGESSLTVACTANTVFTISLDNGRTGTGPTARKMSSAAGDTVTYGLYRDSDHTLPWGTISGGQASAGKGTGSNQSFGIYGSVPVQPTPRPGTYSDRVIVTVAY